MNTKLKFAIPVLALCVVASVVIWLVERDGDKSDAESKALRQTLRQAVKSAKAGDRRELEAIIKALVKGERTYVSEKLLPEYTTYLKDEDGQVQWLGAQGLYTVKSPKSNKALCEYLGSRDYRISTAERLPETERKKINPQQLMWQMVAWSVAIKTLGEVGDKSAIPLLESIREKANIQLEWGGNPIEEALAQLGSVKSLSVIPKGADDIKIGRAATAIGKIRDPNKVPELMATAKNTSTAIGIRCSALDALAAINSPGIPEFILRIMNDPNNDRRVRSSAAVAVGRTKTEPIEKALLAHVENRKSDIRPYALAGLVLYNSDKYFDFWFEKIMDPNEDLEFRTSTVEVQMYIPANIIRGYKNRLYDCLNASDKDGRPIDRIRVLMWRLIYDLYDEEVPVTLTTRDAGVTAVMRSVIDLMIRTKDYRMRFQERQKQVDQEIQRIVTVYDAKAKEGES
jgi:HEAT repeat protein